MKNCKVFASAIVHRKHKKLVLKWKTIEVTNVETPSPNTVGPIFQGENLFLEAN